MKVEELDTKTRLAYKLSMLDESFRTSIIETINDRIEEVANQRIIEELHNLYNEEEEHNDCISKELIYQRIKELKQK